MEKKWRKKRDVNEEKESFSWGKSRHAQKKRKKQEEEQERERKKERERQEDDDDSKNPLYLFGRTKRHREHSRRRSERKVISGVHTPQIARLLLLLLLTEQRRSPSFLCNWTALRVRMKLFSPLACLSSFSSNSPSSARLAQHHAFHPTSIPVAG